MVSIRRKLGAFAVAVMIAAGMVLMPASIHAKGKTSGTIDTFCTELASAIEYANTLPEGTLKDLVLAQLNAIDAAYCN
jgi:hypothetical protein